MLKLIAEIGNTTEKALNKVLRFTEKYYAYFFAFFCACIAFLCFFNLGKGSVLDWDEARHGVSAYEMLKNSDFIVNTFNYKTDYWNLKPPLSFIAIIISYAVFGVSAFSLRFYSAVSFIAFAACTALFVKKYFGKIESLLFLFILCAARPFYIYHCARNGDADALFLLFFTLSVSFSLSKNKFWLGGLFFALAFLTKSWHSGCALFIIALLLVYLAVKKQLPAKKQLVLFAVSAAAPIFIWALLRFNSDGFSFFEKMISYDLLSRTNDGVENHSYGVLFYFKYLLKEIPFIISGFAAAALVVMIKFNSEILSFIRQKEILLLIIWAVLPFVLFSIAKTKLYWYILPALAAAIMLGSVMVAKIIKSGRFNIYLKLFFIVWFAFFICRGGARMVRYFGDVSTDSLQTAMYSIGDTVNGGNAYFEAQDEDGNTNCEFSQSLIFTAEASADLKCCEGGAEAFFENKESDSVLIISRVCADNYDFSNCRVLQCTDEYVIFSFLQ